MGPLTIIYWLHNIHNSNSSIIRFFFFWSLQRRIRQVWLYLICDIWQDRKTTLHVESPLANLASNTALTSTILLSLLPRPAVADGRPPWKRRLQRGDSLVQCAQKHDSHSFVDQVAHSGTRFAAVIPWSIYILYRLKIFVTYSRPPLNDQWIMPFG